MSPPKEETFHRTTLHSNYVPCPRSPTRRQSAITSYNIQPTYQQHQQQQQQPSVTWVSRQSSEPDGEPQQNLNVLSPRMGSQKQRSSRRRRQKPAPLNLRGRGYDAEDDSSSTPSNENSPRYFCEPRYSNGTFITSRLDIHSVGKF